MTIQTDNVSVSRGRSLLIWGLVCGLAGIVYLVYVAGSVAAGGGSPVMPLDDAYIHFQYARVLAEGYPYQYNPGLPATSGATSFLYPYLLAVGYWLGFKGLALGLWAMGIGAVALALTAWLIFRLAVLFRAPVWLAVVTAVGFLLNGAVTWHYMSGMETGLTLLFTVFTVYAVARSNYRDTLIGATLLALIRPEGAILTVLAVAAIVWRERARLRAFVVHSLLPGIRSQFQTINRGAKEALALPHTDDGLTLPILSTTPETPHPTPAPLKPMIGQRPSRRIRLRRFAAANRLWLWLLVPLLAIGVQPLVNLLLTGSPVASGNAAKSLFGIVPFELETVLWRLWDNFTRMWREFFGVGASPVTAGAVTMVLAGFGVAALFEQRSRRTLAVVLTITIVAGTVAVSTLDTAFWHFKRYQMPFIVLFIVLAAAGVTLTRWPSRLWRGFAAGLLVLMSATYILTFGSFLDYYTLNVGYVTAQPLAMARWIDANLPADAVVAVHDTGSLRYIGNRTTLDMVGLTTPGAAEAWRNGPGSVAEFLERARPDYIASYGEGHGYGLGYLVSTGLYAETLATYTVDPDPNYNVALAAATQGIYRPHWEAADRAYDPVMLPQTTTYLDGMSVYDELDVADVYSERVHSYQWHNDEDPGGFPTEVYQFPYIGCTAGDVCVVMDGGRRINADERFTINARAGEDLILITRLHPANAGNYDIFANDVLIDSRVVPAIPGGWLEVPTLIPGELVTEQTRIHIVPRTPGNFYMPYQHWAFQGVYTPLPLPDAPISTFQNGAIGLYNFSADLESGSDESRSLVTSWVWGTDGSAQGDYKIFVHVLNADGSIAAQADVRPGAGTLPPGNWLPGGFRETIRIDVTALEPGSYTIALGLYDPVSGQTLMPEGGDSAGRLMIGSVEIPSELRSEIPAETPTETAPPPA